MTKQKSRQIANKIKEKPVWLKFSQKDIEEIVLKLAKQGLTPEKIGLTLRDSYGIPTTKLSGKKISQILKENNLYKDATLINLEKKQQLIKKHLEKNKQDKKTKRALTIITARISKLKKYKKRKNAEEDQKSS
jgi:ribosomal protein S15P/S13E